LGHASFDSRLIALIRANHPEQAAPVSDAAFKIELRRQVHRARRYGLADEQSVATYAYTAWLLGPDFDERVPALAQVLAAPTLSPPAKAQALDNFVQTVFHALDRHARASGPANSPHATAVA
jgi:hypothetical protein